MRKSGTHSARAQGKKSRGKRGERKRDARVPIIVLCALGAGILATTYGLTHQPTPGASTASQATATAAPNAGKEVAGALTAEPGISEQAARKEDRLVTGSIPKQEEIAPPTPATKTAPQIAKKKKSPVNTAKAEAPKSFFNFF